jgi:hypothetical protein
MLSGGNNIVVETSCQPTAALTSSPNPSYYLNNNLIEPNIIGAGQGGISVADWSATVQHVGQRPRRRAGVGRDTLRGNDLSASAGDRGQRVEQQPHRG